MFNHFATLWNKGLKVEVTENNENSALMRHQKQKSEYKSQIGTLSLNNLTQEVKILLKTWAHKS